MPTAIETRVERAERDLAEHKREDTTRFESLRADFDRMAADLGKRIDQAFTGVQGQIEQFKIDKARSEGKEEGLKEAKTPSPWAIALAPVLVAALLSGVCAWFGHDLFNGASATALYAAPAAVARAAH
jgi:hypothetical protein